MRNDPYTDEELLTALHLAENEGMSARDIATRLGRSRNGLIGAMYRVKRSVEPCPKHDGTMPPQWWKKRKART